MTSLTPGKMRGLSMIADSEGRFTMLAIDQRGSMQKALAQSLGAGKDRVMYEDMAKMKAVITKILAPYASGVLMDPVYGFSKSVVYIPKSAGILLAQEESGYEQVGTERRSTLVKGWSVAKTKKCGADAAKIVIYYNPDTSKETRAYQHDFVRRMGEECEKYDVAFVFEPVSYPKDGGDADTSEFAKAKPAIVRRTVEEFSKPEYKVDLLKLEFPADLKYTNEYANAVFDGKERTPVYTLSEVKGFLKAVDGAAEHPWVILSAGVDIKEFIEQVKLAVSSGASGFLCGRALWKKALGLYPDMSAVSAFLQSEGAQNFKNANAEVYGKALPWFDHKKFGGREKIELLGQGESWYQKVSEDA